MSDFVDLRSALPDNRANHVVGNVDLLSQWLAWHRAAAASWASRSPRLSRLSGSVLCGLLRSTGPICGMGAAAIRHGGLADGRGHRLAMHVGDAITACRGAVGVRMVSLERIRMAVLPTGWLRDIRHNLHTTGDGAGWAPAARGVGRGRRTAETLGELLDKSDGNVVGGDVDGIRNSEDHEGTFSGQGKTGIGSVQAGSRRLLDLTDTATALADN